jgi:hypothetical protein
VVKAGVAFDWVMGMLTLAIFTDPLSSLR